MSEPTRPRWQTDTTVAEEHAEQDRLLSRIEDEQRIPGWCWAPMMETLGKLRGLPDQVQWVGTRYLECVAARGVAVFGGKEHHQTSMFYEENPNTIPCRCGADAVADPAVRHNGVDTIAATCGSCGIVLVEYDGEPYRKPTLIAAGFR